MKLLAYRSIIRRTARREHIRVAIARRSAIWYDRAALEEVKTRLRLLFAQRVVCVDVGVGAG